MPAKSMPHPAWRHLVLTAVALPMAVVVACLAYAWPAANIEPRDLPVGIIGAGATTQQAVTALEQEAPGAYDLKIYGDADAARQAIEDRDVYGAFDVAGPNTTVYTSTAASSTVASLLSSVAVTIDAKLPGSATTEPAGVNVIDVVASDPDDPKGVVLSSALLPLTICSIIIAAAIALGFEFGPAWRMSVALATVSVAAALGIYAVAEWWLGVLPGHGWATWGALSLLIFAMSSTTAGLISLVGSTGLGIGAAMMVFVGNAFSGSSSAPELLPDAVDHIGQWLPPGAGSNLVRSTTYFDGNGAEPHVVILLAWIGFGLLAIFSGHHSFTGFAASRQKARAMAEAHDASAPDETDATDGPVAQGATVGQPTNSGRHDPALLSQSDGAHEGTSHEDAHNEAHHPPQHAAGRVAGLRPSKAHTSVTLLGPPIQAFDEG